MTTHGVLEGIRVIEATSFWMAPWAGSMLGEFGAEVIKVEPLTGDPQRQVPRVLGVPVVAPDGRSYFFEMANRNTKSLCIDLNKPLGKEIICRLVQQSDVFMTNLRSEARLKLGIDYETLRRFNTRLIYAVWSGMGAKGPERDAPAFDRVGLAKSGIMTMGRKPEDVPFCPPMLADQTGGIVGLCAILSALLARERFGIGQQVEMSMLGSMMWLEFCSISTKLFTGREFDPFDAIKPNNPLLNVYQGSDGKWIALSMGVAADKYWPALCRMLGIQKLENDPRFKDMDSRERNSAELVRTMQKVLATRPAKEWITMAGTHDLVISPVNTISDIITDPQVLENDYVVDYAHPALGDVKLVGYPIKFSETPARIVSPAPKLGEHTDEVLKKLGYQAKEIERFKEEGVVNGSR